MSDGWTDDEVGSDSGTGHAGAVDGAALDAMSPAAAAPREPGLLRRAFEYVTFGCGPHHLLKAVVLQFALLFMDIGLVEYVQQGFAPGRQWYAFAVWSVSSLAFVAILVVLVRQMGRRTLAPRFHRPIHLAASVCGYVAISCLSFGFGYATLVFPAKGYLHPTPGVVLPSILLSLVFAAFLAIGYHAQVDATDHPHPQEITTAVVGWLDALSWVEEKPDSLARERGYEEFLARTDDLAELFANAKTIDGSRLAADFRAWHDRFEAHSMLSRETIIRGDVDDGTLESDRLAADHEAFLALRRQLAVLARGVD